MVPDSPIVNSQSRSLNRVPRQLLPADFLPNQATVALLRLGCIAVLMVAALSVPAQDIFLRIGGQAAAMGGQQTPPTLAGDSVDPQYTNWIPVLSMSHGVSRSVTLGGAPGNPSHADVSLMKTLDKTTPAINLLVCGATATVTLPIDYVTIDFRTGGTTNVFYRLELQGVYLTSAQISSSSGDNTVPTESMSLLYSKIRWTFVPYVSGKAQAPITKGWDVILNKSF